LEMILHLQLREIRIITAPQDTILPDIPPSLCFPNAPVNLADSREVRSVESGVGEEQTVRRRGAESVQEDMKGGKKKTDHR